MADTVAEAVQQAAENLTENANVKVPASPEGMALAYGSLVFMALLPIFFGSKRSVSHQKEQKESTEKPDIMTKKDAMMFPVSFPRPLRTFLLLIAQIRRSLLRARCSAFTSSSKSSPRSTSTCSSPATSSCWACWPCTI